MSRFLRIVCFAAALLGMVVRSHATFHFPPELENASDEEKARYLQTEGKRSLNEKTAVGWARYNERIALRQAMADVMRSNFQARSVAIMSHFDAAPPPEATVPPVSPTYQKWVLWIGVACFIGIWIYHRFFERRRFESTVLPSGDLKTYKLD